MDQKELLEKLVEQIGYKESFLKEKYLNIILEKCNSKESISKYIERLINEKKLRYRGLKVKRRNKLPISISSISDFVFCPASFAIKYTHTIPPTEEMKFGTNEHEKYRLLKYIENVLNKYEFKIDSDIDKKKVDYVKYKFKDFYTSKLIYKGHSADNHKLFYTQNKEIVGKPDYIFERENGSRFVAEEKHTFNELSFKKVWDNHIVQIFGYMDLFKNKNVTDGYIFYFQSQYFGKRKSTGQVKMYHFFKNIKHQKLLSESLIRLKTFLYTGEYEFDTQKLNINKCINCSVSPYCKHKSGKFSQIRLPYFKT